MAFNRKTNFCDTHTNELQNDEIANACYTLYSLKSLLLAVHIVDYAQFTKLVYDQDIVLETKRFSIVNKNYVFI